VRETRDDITGHVPVSDGLPGIRNIG